MESPTTTLKAQTKALCRDIEELEQKLGAKAIPFDDAERLWSSAHRPRARILAETLLSYVPSSDLMVVFQAGKLRVIKSDELTCIEVPLSEELASVHLCTVVKGLRHLTDYLPTETDG